LVLRGLTVGEADIINHLAGPTGGIFALGMLAGAIAMWAMNLNGQGPRLNISAHLRSASRPSPCHPKSQRTQNP